jgi:hypothetical protein
MASDLFEQPNECPNREPGPPWLVRARSLVAQCGDRSHLLIVELETEDLQVGRLSCRVLRAWDDGERTLVSKRQHLGSTALLLDQVIHYGLKLDLQEGPHLW